MIRCRPVPFVFAVSVAVTAFGEDWSAFRGPSGTGVSTAVNVPTEWSATENIAWKIDLPGHSNGSPVVFGNRLFVTSAEDDGQQRHLHCFNTHDGSSVWLRTVTFDKTMPTHKTNLYGGTTPVTDGERVVVWHSSAGLDCYDMNGTEQWNRNLGEFRHQWGYGSSPVLHDGKVILHSGPGANVFVAAFDLKSGETLWKTDEPVENDGERNDDNRYMGSWSTPVVAKVDNRDVVVCSMATRVNGYDLHSGDVLWSCSGLKGPQGDLAYTSPVIAGDICVAMGGYKGPAIGFRMGGSGDITESHRLWRVDKGNPQRIGSGVAVDGLIYMTNAGPNTIECIDPATGESRWQQRSPGGAYWGSVILTDGRLYATDQNGTTVVFKPNPEKFEPIATNRLADPGNSTPAVADGTIYIRTFAHLYRIESERK
ncbi:MAG: PQQ-binding-like beta-propeller repeat protein [Planctomycetaceae bacterium]